jgi:hypothetical protein
MEMEKDLQNATANLDFQIKKQQSSIQKIREDYLQDFSFFFNNSDFFEDKYQQEFFKIYFDKIKDGTLEIRKTKEPCHAKMYIFSYSDVHSENGENLGNVITGSSNLTYNGLRGQNEINVRFKNNPEYKDACQIFESLWNTATIIANKEHINAKQFLKPKVLVQRLVAHIENPIPHLKITACYDSKGIIITNTLMSFVINEKIDEKFWLGYLNSKFVSWYAYNFVYARAIRGMDFYNFYIQQIPIPNIFLEQQQPIITLVNILQYKKFFYGKGYEEPRIYDRNKLLKESFNDAIARWKKNVSNYGGRLFFIEDTSVRIDALSDDNNEVPGVDIKYWMQSHNFTQLDTEVKKKGNNRKVSVSSHILLYLI